MWFRPYTREARDDTSGFEHGAPLIAMINHRNGQPLHAVPSICKCIMLTDRAVLSNIKLLSTYKRKM